MDARSDGILRRRMAELEGWFNGPPYVLAEVVFDEHGIVECKPVRLGD